MPADLDWGDGAPRSRLYDDVYFSCIDGLAESRAVFLAGCGLPGGWGGRSHFTVAELGFGTGLNIIALLDLWRRTRDEGARLSILSVEAHLLSRAEAARALEPWRMDASAEVEAVLARWPDERRGFHRIDFPEHGATLDLYVGEVGEALARWTGPADAWFLDGFAPARNPQMWTDAVLAAVARLSAPGARLASFTVAGHVRRGLATAGFEVAKRPGFGAKRERLEGRLPGSAQPQAHAIPPRVAIIGAGVAGAALARAFRAQGVACTIVEAQGPGAGASGNPAALVTPRLDAGFGPAAELHAQAFSRAVALYRAETPGAVVAEGVLQLARGPQDAERFGRVAGWDGFAPDELATLDAEAVAGRLDEPVPDGALSFASGLVVEPGPILDTWLGQGRRVTGKVAMLEQDGGVWRCLGVDGGTLAEAEIVCVAGGWGSAALAPRLGLRPIRGQADYTHVQVFTGAPAAWGAYAIPLRGGGALFGGSHVRGDADPMPRPEETAANLAALRLRRPRLAERIAALDSGQLRSRAATRAATPDHWPVAGAMASGLYGLCGLGGRGFTLAPLLAEHLAAIALGRPSPLPVDLARRLGPTSAPKASAPQA